ncbi:MAG TPA: hypothetical protein VFJ95_10620 [Gammaproteobacteria bacterium]|nr:hypothetical protein [Gammaproteobacteria bacterium]
MAKQGSKLVRDGVQVIQGTPTEPITHAVLFLKLWRVSPGGGKPDRTLASLYMVRPGRTDYVVKELIPDMELGPAAALDKAVAIAKRGDVNTVYLNADVGKLPKFRAAANG